MDTRRRFRWFTGLVPAVLLMAAVGCEQSSSTPGAGTGSREQPTATAANTPTATPPAATATNPIPPPVAVKPSAGTAALVGRVKYNGEPPKRKPINFGPEKKCHEGHEGDPPTDDTLVVSPAREIQWVTVRIAGKVPGTFQAPTQPAVLDQKGCMFAPHILPVMVGQPVEIHSSDPILHNIRSEATLNPSFNRNLPKAGDSMTVKFDAAEMGMKLKCDVHFWMAGYIHVIPHPFFAVTGPDGSFAINNVPPGTYKLEAWHEKLGKLTQDVTVQAGDSKTVEFVFNPK